MGKPTPPPAAPKARTTTPKAAVTPPPAAPMAATAVPAPPAAPVAPVAPPAPAVAANPSIRVIPPSPPEAVIPLATGPLNEDGHVAGAVLTQEQVSNYLIKTRNAQSAEIAELGGSED